MDSSVQQVQILYEISMSIGNKQDIYEMTREALLVYLRKLNCVGGSICKLNQTDKSEYYFEKICALPYSLDITELHQRIVDNKTGFLTENELSGFYSKLPLETKMENGNFFYIFKMADFGCLVLIRSKPFNIEIVKALNEVNVKLAQACKACFNFKQLNESEKKYHDLSEFLPEMICEINREGYLTYANKYALDKMGYTLSEATNGFRFLQLFHPDEKEKAIKNFETSISTNAPLSPREYRAVTKNGKELTVLAHTNKLVENGVLKGVRGVMIDVTELKESERKAKAISESTFEALFFLENGICINENATAEKMFGYSLEEALGKPLTHWIHSSCRKEVSEKISSPTQTPFEAMAIRKDGSTFPSEIQGKMSLIDGKQLQIIALRDISARRDAEIARKESEEKYKLITQSTLDIIFTVDLKGALQFISESVTSVLGYEPAEVIGKSFSDFVPKNEVPRYEAKIKEIFSKSEIKNSINQIYHKNGKLIDVEINGNLIKHKGKPLGLGVIRDISLRMKTERALMESEAIARQYAERFELALLGSEAGLWDWNIETGEVFRSKRWCEMLGYTELEVDSTIGFWKNAIHPDDKTEVVTALTNHLKGCSPLYKTEHRLRTKSGSWLWMLDTGKVIEWTKTGKALRIVGTQIDITEKKNNELKIQQNYRQEELLTEIAFELNSLALFEDRINIVLSKIGNHTGVSRVYIFEDDEGGLSTSNTFEWSNTEITPQKDELQGVPYELIPSWKKILLKEGRVYSENIKQLPSDLVDILEPQDIKSIVVYPLFVNGSYFGFIGFDECNRDISWPKSQLELLKTVSGIIANAFERKIFEESLSKSEAKNRAILESIPDLLFHLDSNGKFLNYKTGSVIEAGMPPEFFIGKNVRDIFSEDVARKMLEAIQYCLSDNKCNFEYSMNVHGRQDEFEARLAKLNKSEVIAVIRNVSERKEYERKLTVERDKANQANQAKSEFLANMSHEIRTPMNAILGFSEALYNKSESIQEKKLIKSILSGGNLLMSLLNDILDLSKIEAGKLELSPQPVDLIHVVKEIKTLFKDKAEKKHISLEVKKNNNFPATLRLDEIRIKQILFNLVGNAINFTHEGFVKVELSFKKTGEEIGDLYIIVSDSGIGIPENQQNIIFESFRQQAGQSNRKYEGAGLGLAISLRLAQKMNGTISVKSQPGEGSVFTVRISNTLISKERPRTPELIHFAMKNIRFQPATLLVVDDVLSNTEMVENLLQGTGLKIITASSGEIAMEILKHAKPDVMMLDLRMPGMDGFEVAEKIKSNPAIRHIPIIAYTASVFSSDKIMNTGNFSGQIYKPVRKSELLNELIKYIPYKKGTAVTKRKANSMFPDISPAIKLQLPEIISSLNCCFLPEWKTSSGSFAFTKIEKFTAVLQETGLKYNFQFLSDYAKLLKEDIEIVDLESIRGKLSKFAEILEYLTRMAGKS